MKLRFSLNFYDFEEFIDVEPEAGSCFILSASEPFNEKMEINFERLSNWLNRLGVPTTTLPHTRFRAHYAHATQRSSKKGGKAKKIYPIHIEHQTYSQSM
ncbi:MAG: hypothetical protein QW282_06435 [Nitrososphaerales archaeon]